MKGYKALLNDMSTKYGDMTYELNKEYTYDEELIMCNQGYHFCETIKDVYVYYQLDSRIFEVEASGNIIRDIDGSKLCTNNIKLIRELSKDEIDKYFKDNIDTLVHDENWYVRRGVAEQGYGLDILVHDENWYVRCAVAKQGYGLDILVHDENWHVRCAVAKQGYGLDILVHDKDWYVRCAVAEQGYGLDILVHDKNWHVRLCAKTQES